MRQRKADTPDELERLVEPSEVGELRQLEELLVQRDSPTPRTLGLRPDEPRVATVPLDVLHDGGTILEAQAHVEQARPRRRLGAILRSRFARCYERILLGQRHGPDQESLHHGLALWVWRDIEPGRGALGRSRGIDALQPLEPEPDRAIVVGQIERETGQIGGLMPVQHEPLPRREPVVGESEGRALVEPHDLADVREELGEARNGRLGNARGTGGLHRRQ